MREILIFADGSCLGNPGVGAYAYRILSNELAETIEKSERYPNTTNNQMELLGVMMALENLQFLKTLEELVPVHVYSDSKYVIDGMNSWIKGWKEKHWRKADGKPIANLDFWQRLDELADGLEITWEYRDDNDANIAWCHNEAGRCASGKTTLTLRELLVSNA